MVKDYINQIFKVFLKEIRLKIHIFTKCTDFLLKLSDISLNLTDAKIVESYNNKKYKNKKRIPGREIFSKI